MTDSFINIFAAIWFFVGFIFAIIGVCMAIKKRQLDLNCTEPVWGKVTDLIKRTSNMHDSDGYPSNTITWCPVFEYDIGEQHFRQELNSSSTKSKYSIGQDVKIYCNPNNYNEYIVAGETTSKTFAIVFIFTGIISCIISVCALVFFSIM